MSPFHSLLEQIDHRPWPLPEGPWQWRQSWNELLFVHYRVETKQIRHLVPDELEIQEFDGTSWIGIVPFRMNNVMKRPLPNMPWFSSFLELNVRLYVSYKGKPGVWFLSLDATNPLVVWGGNTFYNVPYRNAAIEMKTENGLVYFKSRHARQNLVEEFEVQYRVQGKTLSAPQGSLEHFLTERYCFYSKSNGKLSRTDVHHLPWPLKSVTTEILKNTLANKTVDTLTFGQPLFHFSPGVDVISWAPKNVPLP